MNTSLEIRQYINSFSINGVAAINLRAVSNKKLNGPNFNQRNGTNYILFFEI
jgi:hypothetical protein